MAEEERSSHTPGPWHVDRNFIRRSDGKAVAEAMWFNREMWLGVEIDPDANACLIAAAPDMAAALKRALSWLASYPGGCSQNAYMDAVNALKKAGCYD